MAAEIYAQLLTPAFEEYQALTSDIDAHYRSLPTALPANGLPRDLQAFERSRAILSVVKGRLIGIKLEQLKTEIRTALRSETVTKVRTLLNDLVTRLDDPNLVLWSGEAARLYLEVRSQVQAEEFTATIGDAETTMIADREVIARSQETLIAVNERSLRLYAFALSELEKIEAIKTSRPNAIDQAFQTALKQHQIALNPSNGSHPQSRSDALLRFTSAFAIAVVDDDAAALTKVLKELRVQKIQLADLGPFQGRDALGLCHLLQRTNLSELISNFR